jgi:nicotinamidase-related amidase
MGTPRLKRNDTALLIVDMQQRLVPAMHDPDTLTRRMGRLIDGADALELPTVVTEQYPKGLGPTVPSVNDKLGHRATRVEKTCFTACTEAVLDRLTEAHVHCVAVAGIEAHVCLMQTCLDLVDRGYVVGAVLDATDSRRPQDRELAEHRMRQAGVLPMSVESTLMELVGDAADPSFKQVREVIK